MLSLLNFKDMDFYEERPCDLDVKRVLILCEMSSRIIITLM